MSTYSCVVDTNVFVDGLFSNDPDCLKVMDLIENNIINLYFSRDTIGELMQILKNFSRHNLTEEDGIEILQNFAALFYTSKSYNDSKVVPTVTLKDTDDTMFLKCAIRGNVDYLITNDRRSGLFGVTDYSFQTISASDFIAHHESDDELGNEVG
ncbi:putative toxin-antitoxin system toxin component, PIN family [Paenibacillus sp. USHLN196]|uniref:putative toxin-antitoxin system toxin component, PIN family n=1 Tax=Paenibacillus sp. USHLN196 TaxID=3081291 RepID=UPI003019C99A